MSNDKKPRRYDIGQLLFVIPAGKTAIVPIMIIEEVVKRTIKGEEINYRVQAGADEAKTLMLTDINGEVFESLKEIQKELLARTQKAVSVLVENVKKKAAEWFKITEINEKPAKKTAENKEDRYNHLNALGMNEMKPFVPPHPKQNTEPHIDGVDDDGAVYTVVELPNGMKAKFRQ